jgi:arylsulfatase A-like enzyme
MRTGAAVLLVHFVSPWCCAAECTLATLASTCLEGNSYKNLPKDAVGGTVSGCCAACEADAEGASSGTSGTSGTSGKSGGNCSHFTYNTADKGQECRLKSGTPGKKTTEKSCTSGVTPPKPTPAPPPPPPTAPPTPPPPTPAPDPDAPRPNIIAILADDLGWYDTAVYNPDSPTPVIAALAHTDGLILDHQHVFRYCSPTRRSFLSGRFPNHISTAQPDGANMCSDFLPLNLTTLAQKLKTAAAGGYATHYVGKGHLGYETTDHLPIHRGFDDHVGYLGGSEGYEYGSGSVDPTTGKHDMWHGDHPGIDVVPEIYYSANYYAGVATKFIEGHGAARRAWQLAVKAEKAKEAAARKEEVEAAAAAKGSSSSSSSSSKISKPRPFFMYLAIQNVHSPYTLPPAWETREHPAMWDKTYANMLAMLDSAVANVTQSVRDAGLWNDTLILFTADNGGIGRGNNHPLRGHKHDPWEGGTRATAFLTGGFLPAQLRGTATGPKLVHVADW